MKANYDVINNLTNHRECKTGSAHEKIQKELDEMIAKYEAQKAQHESELS
jgi:polyhydroxyalkanoate synthesis regulator phasin